MATYNLCSLSDMQTVLQAPSAYDSLYNSARATATSLIEESIRRKLDLAERTEVLPSRYSIDSYINPVRYTLSGINIDSSKSFTLHFSTTNVLDSSTLVDPSEYDVDFDTGTVWLRLPTFAYSRSLHFTYTSGYDVISGTDVYDAPDDLKNACLQQALWIAERILSTSTGSDDSKDGDRTVPMSTALRSKLLPEVLLITKKYTKPLVGRM